MPRGSLSGMVFNYNAPAELFSTAPGVRKRNELVRYDRFVSAAEAIRHAVEQLHSAGRIVLEVNEERYADAVIRELYASAAYPLTRCKKAVTSVS